MRANPAISGVSSLATPRILPHIAVIYVRQSSHRESERTVSPEDQEAQCRALPAVAACSGVEVYRDLNLSGGSTRRRAGLNALLERVRSGGVAVVAALDQSRAFRNTADALAFYALMETRPEIRVDFVKGHFDRSAVGGFTYTTLAAANEMERKMAGEKTASALRYMIARGEMVSKVPLGYRRTIEGQGQRIDLDADWAPTVLRIFEDYGTGRYSARMLAERLNAEGIRPPSFRGGWRADTLLRILGNPTYAGRMPLDGRTGRGELVPGQWPVLVSQEAWDAVQRARVRIRRGGRGPHRPPGVYAFQGLLRCADCGRRMYAQTPRESTYYRCKVDGNGGCGRAIRDADLLPWGRSLMAWLEAAGDWPDLRPAIASLLDRPSRPPDALAQLEASLERVGQRFEWGDIDAAEYQDKRARLLSLRTEILATQQPAARLVVAGLVRAWDSNDSVVRRALLSNLFSELDVRDGRIIEAQPRYDVEAEVTQRLKGWESEPRLRYG